MSVSAELSDRTSRRIEGYREAMAGFQKQVTALTAIGPENGGEGEWERSVFLEQLFSSWGLVVKRHDAADLRVPTGKRPNLVARMAGQEPGPTVWILVHIDTVPPGDLELWDTPPFEATLKNGKVYGRGTVDNQQGLTAAAFAVRALLDEGLIPTSEVALLLVSDEETGNEYGLEHVLRQAPDLIAADDLVVVPDSGGPDGSFMEVAEKSTLWVEITVIGRQTHASMPEAGSNSHRAAANLTVWLDRRLHERFPGENELFSPPGCTFEPTKREANVPNVNTIPGRDRLYFDCRVLPEYDLEEVRSVIEETARHVEEAFDVTVELAYPQFNAAAPPTSPEAPVVLELADAIRQVRGIEPLPVGIGGGTLAALLRRQDVPAVVWVTMDEMAHQPNEYASLDSMIADAKVFAHLMLRGQ